MWERLEQLNRRYDELQAQLSAPETYENPALVARLNREQRELAPVVETFRAADACRDALTAAEALLQDGDPEVRVLAKEETAAERERLSALERQLKELLLPRAPEDEKSVILELRAGVGGEEATLFAQSLLRMYAMYADRQGWKLEVDSMNATELGGVKEAVCSIQGAGVYARLKYESGVHRVQRVPVTESGGRIHTSTATVAVLPEVDEVDFELDLSEVRIDTFRASGAGGQHINKTESAIRATHMPTGIVVECQDQRSQYKNKDRALAILRARLYQRRQEEQSRVRADQRRSQVGSGMRNERIRTYNFPQGRVTDHRIGLTLYQIDDVLNGALDEVIDALAAADRAAQLQAQSGAGEEKK